MIKWVLPITMALCVTWLLPVALQAGSISKDLEMAIETLGPDEEAPIIVVFADRMQLGATAIQDYAGRRPQLIRALKTRAELSQNALKGFLNAQQIKRRIPLWVINGMAISAGAEGIRRLAELPFVQTINLDRTISLFDGPGGLPTDVEWNVSLIGAPDLWKLGYLGEHTVVAAMDSGVDPDHPDLKARYRGGSNSWYDPHGQHSTPFDADGHGTQVMGVMVGGASGGSAIGVAPEARWIAVKIFDDSGKASLSAIHQGFQWLLDPDGNPDTDDGPDVVNNSWGFVENLNECVEQFQPDLEALRAANIGVVFSAGNGGPLPATSISPANLPGSFSVGFIDGDYLLAPSSSRGPAACDSAVYPELVAPGVAIRTADLSFGGVVPDPFTTVTGSSFAAPHVAGALALLKNAFPAADLPRLESALKISARDLGTVGPDHEYGHGSLDVMEAYLYLLSNSGEDTAPPLIVSVSASPNPTKGAPAIEINALVDDSFSGGSNITAAEWWHGATPPAPGAASPLKPKDGSFDFPIEELVGEIDVANWSQGTHTLYVRGRDEAGNWSAPTLLHLKVTRKPKDVVRITRIKYTGDGTLIVWATSTAPGGSVILTAYATIKGVKKELGTLPYRPHAGEYRKTFRGVCKKPAEVLVVSSGGGRARQLVP